MSHTQSPQYSFDLADGPNNRRNGGYLLGLTDHVFAYVLNGPDGMFQYAFVALRDYDDVKLWKYSMEVSGLHDKVSGVLEDEHSSVHGSVGQFGGVRVEFYPRLHILGRDSGSSADDTDIRFPPSTYDYIIRRIGDLANACTNADLSAALRMLATGKV